MATLADALGNVGRKVVVAGKEYEVRKITQKQKADYAEIFRAKMEEQVEKRAAKYRKRIRDLRSEALDVQSVTETVGDDQAGAGAQNAFQRFLDQRFGGGVDAAGRFIQHQHGVGAVGKSTRQGQQLALAL